MPETIAHAPSENSPTTSEIAPSTASCSWTWPLLGSTNCGSTAVSRIIAFGLVTPTTNPSRSIRLSPFGAIVASIIVASLRLSRSMRMPRKTM